jgi:hypothetical protein
MYGERATVVPDMVRGLVLKGGQDLLLTVEVGGRNTLPGFRSVKSLREFVNTHFDVCASANRVGRPKGLGRSEHSSADSTILGQQLLDQTNFAQESDVLAMLAMVAVPAGLTLRTVSISVTFQTSHPNPTPYGYTVSLLPFIIPIVVIACWFLPSE